MTSKRNYPYEQLESVDIVEENGDDPNQAVITYPAGNSSGWSSAGSANSSFTNQSTEQSNDPNETQIRVVVRVRPLNQLELSRSDSKSVVCLDDNQTIQIVMGEEKQRALTFHRVHDESCSQQSFFEESGIVAMLDKALEGYSATVFAYGQTSSGKTHTMTGPDHDGSLPSDIQGLIPRALHYIYAKVAKIQNVHYNIRAAYLEIYNEQVRDLLNHGATNSLPVRWKTDKGFYVENIFVVECDVFDDSLAVLEEGIRNRKTGCHQLNEHSSRSHSILTVYLESETVDPEDKRLVRRNGKISFVDLAGSEKVKESKATGGTFTEMLNINKSLLTLGNCISALADPKRKLGHIPFRDSKLTKLLSDSLGGNGFTLMIACISPASYNLNETLKTLRYANRAKNIKNRPIIQMDPREELILHLKRENKVLKQENLYLRSLAGVGDVDLSAIKGDSNFVSKITSNMLNMRNQTMFPSLAKPQPIQKELEQTKQMAENYSREIESLKKENIELNQLKNLADKQVRDVMQENESLMAKLERLERIFLDQNHGKPHKNDVDHIDNLKKKSIDKQEMSTLHTNVKTNVGGALMLKTTKTSKSKKPEVSATYKLEPHSDNSDTASLVSVISTRQKIEDGVKELDHQIRDLKTIT